MARLPVAASLLAVLGLGVLAQAPPRSPSPEVDSRARDFEAAPTLAKFDAFGDTLMFDGGEHHGPTMRGDALVLPKHPVFEAMKNRLAAGIVVSRREMPQTVETGERYISERVAALVEKSAPLPAVTPSHFAREDAPFVIALSPFTLADLPVEFADALSAWHQVGLRARVLAPAWAGTHGPMGSWDVGVMGITYDRPARVHAIGARGAATGADVISLKASLDVQCGTPSLEVRATPVNASWRSATVAWLGKAPLRGRGNVTVRQAGGPDKYDKVAIETIDLNGDAVPDFITVAGMEPEMASTETQWKVVFANIAGVWTRAASAQQADCT